MRAASCWSSRSSANPISRAQLPRNSQDRTHAQLRAVVVLAAQQGAALSVRLVTIVVGTCFVMSCAAATDASEFEQEKRANVTPVSSTISIRIKTGKRLYDCPCVVMGPYGCATAAHCVDDYDGQKYDPLKTVSSWPDGETWYAASDLKRHPQWKPIWPKWWDFSRWGEPRRATHDVAMVFFDKPLGVPAAPLVPEGQSLKNNCEYSLYGLSEWADDKLRPLCLKRRLKHAWEGSVAKHGDQVCSGDSGGAVFPKHSRFVIGIQSSIPEPPGVRCSSKTLIAPVALNRKWLTSMVALAQKRR